MRWPSPPQYRSMCISMSTLHRINVYYPVCTTVLFTHSTWHTGFPADKSVQTRSMCTNMSALYCSSPIGYGTQDFPLTKVYSADEAFVTGTMAGQIPVRVASVPLIAHYPSSPCTQNSIWHDLVVCTDNVVGCTCTWHTDCLGHGEVGMLLC